LATGLRNELKDYEISYHVFDGDTSLMFPTLTFDESSIPAGDAATKCIHVKWTDVDQEEV
jgi:hypothetical protein